MRQYLSLAAFILLVGVLAWGILAYVRSGAGDEADTSEEVPSGTVPGATLPAGGALPGAPTDERIVLGTPQGNVSVRNFYRAVKDAEEMVIVIEKTNAYFISYDTQVSTFWIAVTGTPFEAARTGAEQGFLDLLGISKEDACKLSVSESVPYSVNPALAGRSFGLSFCASALQ